MTPRAVWLRSRTRVWLIAAVALVAGGIAVCTAIPNRAANPLPSTSAGEATRLQRASPQKAGTSRLDAAGVEQVWVPPGCFRRGADPAKESANWYETPQHDVCLTTGFWIDKYEVTHEAFERFVNDGGYQRQEYWSADGWQSKEGATGPQPAPAEFSDPKQPRTWINWHEAEAYARWRGGRLPTEAQWEYAARGPESPTYPWGDTWDVGRVNVGESGHERTVAVDWYANGRSWCGALQMAGNAWEWTADWFDLTLYRQPVSRNPRGPSTGTEKIFRGGSYASFGSHPLWFDFPPESARTSRRSGAPPGTRSVTRGMRVVTIE